MRYAGWGAVLAAAPEGSGSQDTWSLLPDQGVTLRRQALQARVSLKGPFQMPLHWVPPPPALPCPR